EGVHENTTLPYRGMQDMVDMIHRKDRQIDGLRLGKLNSSRRIRAITAKIDINKRLLLALASGKAQNADRILQIGLKN
ncbi:hypothetical protein K435DRAFT_605038, partial [Dendrothele bispora CBS 962.96]